MLPVRADAIFTEISGGAVDVVNLRRYPDTRFELLQIPMGWSSVGHLVYAVPVANGDIFSHTHEPDPRQMHAAMVAFESLATKRGQQLRDHVASFIRNYGALDPVVLGMFREWPGYPEMHVPKLLQDSIYTLNLDDENGLRPAPVYLYAHEARNLRATIQLYTALVDDDIDGVRRWIRAHPPSGMMFKAELGIDPSSLSIENAIPYWQRINYYWKHESGYWESKWSPYGWMLLRDRLFPYIRSFIALDTIEERPGMPGHRLSTKSKNGIYEATLRYRIIANGVLGMVYAQLVQLIVSKNLMRPCHGCQSMFVPKQRNQTYCTKQCGNAARKRRERSKSRD